MKLKNIPSINSDTDYWNYIVFLEYEIFDRLSCQLQIPKKKTTVTVSFHWPMNDESAIGVKARFLAKKKMVFPVTSPSPLLTLLRQIFRTGDVKTNKYVHMHCLIK